MVKRFFPLVCLFVLVAAPAPARPAAAKEAKAPTLVVRLSSIDDLIADAKYLANLAGHEEEGKQIDAMIKSQLGDKGLQGIDTKRPLGLYVLVSPDLVGSTGAFLVPVADEAAFLDLLDRLTLKPEKGEDGLYTVMAEKVPVPFYFRFAHKYAYVAAQNKAALAKDKLLDPAGVLQGHTGTLSAVVRFDQVPDEVKNLALSQVDLKASIGKDEKGPGETEAQHRLKEKVLDDLSKRVGQIVREGGELRFRFNLDRQANEVGAELTLSGKSGSKLTANLADLAKAQSLFAGLMGGESAMNLLLHWSLPEDLRQALEPVIDNGIKKALENEKDETRRGQAEKFFKALEPSFKSGDLDTVFSLRGPQDKLYTFVAGIRLKEGKGVERAVRDLVKGLPERDRDKIKFDAETVNGVKVHRVDVQNDLDEQARQTLGEHPIYFAIRDDAALVGGGPDGLNALKSALAARPQAAPQFELAMAVARLAPLMAAKHPSAPELAKRVFKEGSGDDRIRFTVKGGDTLELRVTAKAQLLKFFSEVEKDSRGAGADSLRGPLAIKRKPRETGGK
jgi:hypothetical protein